MTDQIKQYPEWKQLAEEISSRVQHGRIFTYEELAAMTSGLDIRTPKGRSQFFKFRAFAIREWGVWFECVAKVGYRVIQACEHGQASSKRVRSASRKLKTAHTIATNVHLDKLTEPQQAQLSQIVAMTGAILQAVEMNRKEIKKIARAIAAPNVAEDAAETIAAYRSGRVS